MVRKVLFQSSCIVTASWPPPLPVIRDVLLRVQAFTLPTPQNNHLPHTHYQRLEFLGDQYLGLAITRILFDRFPIAREGPLTRVKQVLVANKSLTRYAATYNFGALIDEVNNAKETCTNWNAPKRGKILADCFEAYIAAVALSDTTSGFDTLTSWLAALYEPEIRDLSRVEGLLTAPGFTKRAKSQSGPSGDTFLASLEGWGQS